MNLKYTLLTLCMLFTALVGYSSNSDANNGISTQHVSSEATLDAIAPWVQRTRYIPVYVDGVLVGHIVHTYWHWQIEF